MRRRLSRHIFTRAIHYLRQSVLGSVAGGQVEGVVAVKAKAPLKWRQATPLNTAVLFVPQQEAWIVERMGK